MALHKRMIEARRALARRFHRGFVMAAGRLALVLVDLLRMTCEDNPLPALRGLPQLDAGPNVRLKPQTSTHFQAYQRVQWFKGKTFDMKVCVEHGPSHGWLPEYAVTFFADDRSGLVRERILSVLEVMPPAALRKVEIAIDFAMVTPVDRKYVIRHGIFGKSKRDRNVSNADGDWWGARRGGKRVVSYRKDAVAAQRVEFKLRGRFLKQHGISNVLDFGKFAQVLPGHHIHFAHLDEQKLITRLSSIGMTATEKARVLRAVQARNDDLCATLDYLRRVVGLKNVRRLLVPLKTNALVSDSFKEFVTKWPATVRRVK